MTDTLHKTGKTVLVRATFVLPVVFPADYTDEDIDREIEQGCLDSRNIGLAFDERYALKEENFCWACSLGATLERAEPQRNPVAPSGTETSAANVDV